MEYIKNVVTLKLDKDKCVGCGMCAVVCAREVFSMDGKKANIECLDRCIECGACAMNCPVDAIEVVPGVG